MAQVPFRPPLPATEPVDPLARPTLPPAPPPPGVPAPGSTQDTRAWVQSRMPVWAQTNPLLDPNSTDYMVGRINENGGLNDPRYNAAYWDQKMSQPPVPAGRRVPLTAGVQPNLANAGPPSSDVLTQILAELQAQQTGQPSPLTRQVQLQLLRGK